MKHLKKIIFASVIVALASQVNIGLLGTDFRVSGGIILFAILLFLYKDLKPVPTRSIIIQKRKSLLIELRK